MPISGQGWELHIVRQSNQVRTADRRRTVGSYQVYHNGAMREGLQGVTAESKGPGANHPSGNGRRIKAGAYRLGTHDGHHYQTIGYIVTTDPDQTPKPGLEVRDTDERTAILVHPGHGFLASIGCINLSAPLPDPSVDIPFVDSRDRVIKVIDDLRSFSGSEFPHYNGKLIPGTWVVIDGEP